VTATTAASSPRPPPVPVLAAVPVARLCLPSSATRPCSARCPSVRPGHRRPESTPASVRLLAGLHACPARLGLASVRSPSDRNGPDHSESLREDLLRSDWPQIARPLVEDISSAPARPRPLEVLQSTPDRPPLLRSAPLRPPQLDSSIGLGSRDHRPPPALGPALTAPPTPATSSRPDRAAAVRPVRAIAAVWNWAAAVVFCVLTP
jgi:hypothetical protein